MDDTTSNQVQAYMKALTELEDCGYCLSQPIISLHDIFCVDRAN